MPESNGVPPVLTLEELAQLLRVSPRQVQRLQLPGVLVGKRWRYVTDQVLETLKRRAE